jgi:uncharacterized membrane protein
MKESKKFFDNNYLNKGHEKKERDFDFIQQNKSNIFDNKRGHLLPPIEVIEYYEDISPGTLEKLLTMAQKEQEHRHSMILMALERKNKEIMLGRLFLLTFVLLVCVTTFLLSVSGYLNVASIFSFSAFASIAGGYYVQKCSKKQAHHTAPSKARFYRKNNQRKR